MHSGVEFAENTVVSIPACIGESTLNPTNYATSFHLGMGLWIVELALSHLQPCVVVLLAHRPTDTSLGREWYPRHSFVQAEESPCGLASAA